MTSMFKDPKAYAKELREAFGSDAEALKALPEAKATFRAPSAFWEAVAKELGSRRRTQRTPFSAVPLLDPDFDRLFA